MTVPPSYAASKGSAISGGSAYLYLHSRSRMSSANPSRMASAIASVAAANVCASTTSSASTASATTSARTKTTPHEPERLGDDFVFVFDL